MKHLIQKLAALCLFLSLLMNTALAGNKGEIIIAASSGKPALYRIATRISQQLIERGIDSALLDVDKSTLSILKNADVVIAVGNRLSQDIAEQFPDQNLIAITTSAPDVKNSRKKAVLVIQQPLCRQILLIKSLSDKIRSVSVMASDNSMRKPLQRCADKHKLTLRFHLKHAGESLAALLSRALDSDIILALPDRNIYNQKTVKTILLQAYRRRIPLIGFSRSFVNAGALAALHSTPEQLATQVTDLVQTYLQTGKLKPGRQYPRDYNIYINNQVSNALQLELPDVSRIRDSIQRGEAR